MSGSAHVPSFCSPCGCALADDAASASNAATPASRITLIFLSPEIAAKVQRRRHHAADRRYPFVGGSCFLVASPHVRDLLLSAKHLFIAAIDGKRPQSLTAGAS